MGAGPEGPAGDLVTCGEDLMLSEKGVQALGFTAMCPQQGGGLRQAGARKGADWRPFTEWGGSPRRVGRGRLQHSRLRCPQTSGDAGASLWEMLSRRVESRGSDLEHPWDHPEVSTESRRASGRTREHIC